MTLAGVVEGRVEGSTEVVPVDVVGVAVRVVVELDGDDVVDAVSVELSPKSAAAAASQSATNCVVDSPCGVAAAVP